MWTGAPAALNFNFNQSAYFDRDAEFRNSLIKYWPYRSKSILHTSWRRLWRFCSSSFFFWAARLNHRQPRKKVGKIPGLNSSLQPHFLTERAFPWFTQTSSWIDLRCRYWSAVPLVVPRSVKFDFLVTWAWVKSKSDASLQRSPRFRQPIQLNPHISLG